MNIYIVVQEKLANAVDWSTIYSPEKYRLILITTPIIDAAWSTSQRQYFESIFKEESLTDEVLHNIVSKIIIEFPNDNIHIMTNEENNLLKCAKIRTLFGLEGDTEEVITIFRNKHSMKTRLIANGLENLIPKYKIFDPNEITEDYAQQLVDLLCLPIFCKPTAESACRGTCILRNIEEIVNWIQQHRHAPVGTFEFDEYITGESYHCDSIVRHNTVLHAEVSRYLYPCFEYKNGHPCASIVLDHNDPLLEKIRNFNQTILNGLQTIPNCITHLEIFKTDDNRLIFLEIAARPPGALVCPIYEFTTGLDFKLIHYKLQMNLDFDVTIKQRFYAASARFPRPSEKIIKLNRPTHLQSEFEFEHDTEFVTGSRRLVWMPDSYIILWNRNYNVLEADFNSLRNFVPALTAQ